MARISGFSLLPCPGVSKDKKSSQGTQRRDTPRGSLDAHHDDSRPGTNLRDSVTVDIASLLKGSATDASSAIPPQHAQFGQPASATSGPATTLPSIIAPPSSYADPAAPNIAVTYGARVRRNMPQSQASDSPAKKQSKWSAEEDALIIELRGSGMKWDDISKRLPGRSPISCRLHYQNYLEKRSEWDEERKNKLARLYER